MTMDTKDLTLSLDKARWWILQNQPFYASFVMKLVDKFRDDLPTAATDGRHCFWNPGYLAKLTPEQVRGVLLHEGLHCGLLHLWRLPADERGNRAGDYEINLIVKSIPGCDLPAGVLLDEKYRDTPCEVIYGQLTDDPSGGKPGPGDFLTPAGPDDKPGAGPAGKQPGTPGAGATPADGTGTPGDSLRDDWEATVIQASQAFGRGATPGAAAAVLARVKAPRIDWRTEMAEFVRDAVSMRNDWSRTNRRMATAPVVYPRRMRDTFGLLVFVRDTSGSIGSELCAEFTAHIDAAVASTGARAVVYDCDTDIQAEHWLTAGVPCPLDMVGGGGTTFDAPFERVAELEARGERIAGVVYLTDLEGSFPEPAPSVPTLWIAAPGYYGACTAVAPFGRTVAVAR